MGLNINNIVIIYTYVFGSHAPEGTNEPLSTVNQQPHLISAAPYKLGQGKLGSMCGEITFAMQT